jgi:hypothetical protein
MPFALQCSHSFAVIGTRRFEDTKWALKGLPKLSPVYRQLHSLLGYTYQSPLEFLAVI